MALDINTIKQASPKANQVATEQYVDTSIAGIDVTQDISANNDTFAQSQGFSSYSDMATKYTALKKTIISGGYINTGLVNANSIVANSISADKISSYNLTSTNAAIQNGLITNAKIADAAITSAKIGDAQITTAKIGDLSVSTLKIQDEAVIVPRSAEGSGSTTIVYTTGETPMKLLIFANSSYGGGSSKSSMILYVNGTAIDSWYTNNSSYGGKVSFMKIVSAAANTTYTITFTSYYSGNIPRGVSLSMLGAKK